jgi:hypothetical protein
MSCTGSGTRRPVQKATCLIFRTKVRSLPPLTRRYSRRVKRNRYFASTHTQAALQKAIFRDGFVPNSPEFQINFGGSRYVGQRAERLSDGLVRVYYARLDDLANVQHVERD